MIERRPPLTLPPQGDPHAHTRRLEALYDSELAYLDAELGRLLEPFEAADDVIVILISDHGEAFYEHGYWGHSVSLHEEELRIPLLIRLPGAHEGGCEVETPVNILDVMPTVLELAGIESEQALQGRSLVDLLRGDGVLPERALFAELSRHRNDVQAVRRGDWKLILDRRLQRELLYDLASDPHETRNLAAMRPDVHRELRQLIERYRFEEFMAQGEAAGSEARAPSLETQEQLRALGYAE